LFEKKEIKNMSKRTREENASRKKKTVFGDAIRKAAEEGDDEFVKQLLENKTDMDEKDTKNVWKALLYACFIGHNKVVQTLLNYSADAVNHKNKYGVTVLLQAASKGHNDIVQTLLNHNAAVDAKTNNNNNTALLCAAYNGHDQIVRILLNNNADINEKTTDGCSALFGAVLGNRKEVVQTLLVYGASSDEKNDEETALEYAQRNDHSDIVATLTNPQKFVSKARIDLVRERALQVCIGLQSLGLDALRTCEILRFACGPVARLIPFHIWWNIATAVKHFRCR
jgi:ankyrin repeat protein